MLINQWKITFVSFSQKLCDGAGAKSILDFIFAWTEFLGLELLLFAAIWLFLGALDDIAVDIIWLWHKFRKTWSRRAGNHDDMEKPLPSDIDTHGFAIFISAWEEADVIGHMLSHCRRAWPDDDIRIYVGCYPNDYKTMAAVDQAAARDPRIQMVINSKHGPTSKADCLNSLWRQLLEDQKSGAPNVRAVVLHDAEDVVHADSLRVFSYYLQQHDFVQIPVIPLVNRNSYWISGHYCDEFAEAHGKAMVVRGAVDAGLPAAGVGCAFSIAALHAIAQRQEAAGNGNTPFDADSLTEDYELGLSIKELGGSGVFVRRRGMDGELVATSEYFPGDFGSAARQKSRWMAGIALLGWERMGWRGNFAEKWMRLRDRRAVLAALVLCAAYLAMICVTIVWVATWFGLYTAGPIDHALALLLFCNAAMLVWRAAFRFGFTWAQYGFVQGLMSVPRIFIGNIISIMAARRALVGYIKELGGHKLTWEKTTHIITDCGDEHPHRQTVETV